MSDKFFIGIDLGGTKICGAVANEAGTVLAKYTLPTEAAEGEAAVLARVIAVVEAVINESKVPAEQLGGIGIGSPGPLDMKQGVIIAPANLPFRNFNIAQPLKDRFGLPVYLDNDANAAAIAEYVFGAGKGTEHMIFITVSTGIGAGGVLNGKVYRGNTYNAMEVGHCTVEKDGPRCNCGNNGCAELYASGTAIGRAAQMAVAGGQSTVLSQYDKPTAYEVFQAAEAGDAVAAAILEQALHYLGICVANTIMSFDPEVVILGGGVAQAGERVFNSVKKVVAARCLPTMAENTRIVPAALGTDAGVLGAVALAIMESKN